MNVLEEAKKIEQEIIKWRRDLHKIPELNLYLPKTTKYVEEKLKEMGVTFDVRKVPADSKENMDSLLKKAKTELQNMK